MPLRQIASNLVHPVQSYRRAVAYTQPNKLWRRYVQLCVEAGLSRPAFIFSMDCDTEQDIDVVEEVHAKLLDRGIMTVYAVPGELLERGADVYRRVADTGAEFLNHGYRQHTLFDASTSEYRSFLFYNDLSATALEVDVREGHQTVQRVLGRVPTGFRTPHFGSFQKPGHLTRLHRLLDQLDYTFSSSTMPSFALWRGPASRRYGLYEIPVTGCYDWPLRILDSWGFRFAPGRDVGEADYVDQARKLARFLEDAGPCLINLYADPSQVFDWPEFFDAIGAFAKHNVPSYESFLSRVAK